MIAAKAKESQERKPTDSVKQNSAEQIETRKVIAEKAGVSHDTISKTEKILEYGTEETKAKLRTGEISSNGDFLVTQKTKGLGFMRNTALSL